jgi:hypothetical protein
LSNLVFQDALTVSCSGSTRGTPRPLKGLYQANQTSTEHYRIIES